MDITTLPSLLSLKVAPPSELQNQNIDNGIGEEENGSVKLPAALEQALAFKTERTKEVGGDPNDVISVNKSPKNDNEGIFPLEHVITKQKRRKNRKGGNIIWKRKKLNKRRIIRKIPTIKKICPKLNMYRKYRA
jgi:hypothetical protein